MNNFIKSTNTYTPDWTSPERRLFIAVLSQAVHDAFSNHVPELEKRQAQAWLMSNSKDFKKSDVGKRILENKVHLIDTLKRKEYLSEFIENAEVLTITKKEMDKTIFSKYDFIKLFMDI